MNEISYGHSIKRREDDRFISGRGQYVDDVQHESALRAAFVRAPMASAKVISIDISAALEQPGVIAVLTAADMDAENVLEYSVPSRVTEPNGKVSEATPRPFLIKDQVRYLGEPVAIVIAETNAQAHDAVEFVDVEYEIMDAVADTIAASSEGAALVWQDRPENLAFYWRKGDVDAVEAEFANAHHVTQLKSYVTRVSAMPMEPRTALASIDETGRPVLRVSHQSPHSLRNLLCTAFKLKKDELRVIAGDVGGSFGMKSGLMREEAVVFWAARHLQKPIRWTAMRSEAILSDEHGRDIHINTTLALDKDGKFTALKVSYDINIGAYLSGRSSSPISNFGGIAGVYTTKYIVGEAKGYFTHTQPTAAYRGAGRPDATYAIERVIDVAASEMGIDRIELRRRNLIAPEAMPYQTPFVFKYDCGEFERNMDRALELADYDGFEKRQKDALTRGKLRGLGLSNPIEVAAGPYGKPSTDFARVEAHADGTATVYSGAMSVGQGLETSFTTLVSQLLGLPLEAVKYVQGDTDRLTDGKGNGGSASLTLCGSAIQIGAHDLIEKGRQLAANALEVSPGAIEFSDGSFQATGSNRYISLAEVAKIADNTEDTQDVGLMGVGAFTGPHATFPNGSHLCEVEIDPETGVVEVLNYVSVEDVGNVLNPVLVEGQIHGGVAQGLGQVILEAIQYDEDGQLITGSFMDYGMPRADNLPNVIGENLETPTAMNPLGVKGVGEAGTVGALAAGMNAVCDALALVGIKHFDMPATPGRVWLAIQEAKATN